MRFLLLALLTLFPASLSAQQPTFAGGGAFEPEKGACITPLQRARILAQLRESMARLDAEGRLPAARTATTQLQLPLASASGFPDPGFYGISNFVDRNPQVPNRLQDYMCGTRTYDLADGYNHAGIDYFTWPFGWLRMDQNAVEIRAAAPGVIVFKSDGNPDRSCNFTSSTADWNAVYVRHDDGTVAWYGHMKRHSTTAKAVGASVEAGEYLGVVGSSGRSSGPHLHFELSTAFGSIIDPNSGTCNSNPTRWATQPAYFEPQVVRTSTQSASARFPTCPQPEQPFEKTVFARGDTIFYSIYLRDERRNDQVQMRIFRPDGSLFNGWTFTSGVDHYAASYWTWWFLLPTNEASGTWSVTATYGTQPSTTTTFTYGVNVGTEEAVQPAAFTLGEPYPNPARTGTRLPLRLAETQVVTVEVVDVLGRRVSLIRETWPAGVEREVLVDAEALVPGVYLIHLQGTTFSASRRFVKTAS